VKFKAEKPMYVVPDDESYEQCLAELNSDRGFSSSELWNLDVTIAMFVLPRLKEYRKKICSFPWTLTVEEYEDILDKIIAAFELVVDNDRDYVSPEGIQEGLDLFSKYFLTLWD